MILQENPLTSTRLGTESAHFGVAHFDRLSEREWNQLTSTRLSELERDPHPSF